MLPHPGPHSPSSLFRRVSSPCAPLRDAATRRRWPAGARRLSEVGSLFLRPRRLGVASRLGAAALATLLGAAAASTAATAAPTAAATSGETAGEPVDAAAVGDTAAASDAAERVPGEVLVVSVDSIVHPVLADFLVATLAEADAVGAEAVVIELATPGGLLTSTRKIFSAMLGARTPVVIYVAPTGSHAASAGFFLLMAADVAAMAPGTNTGAAHPVGAGGEDVEGTMGDKVEEDSLATIRTLAARHDRDLELAEAAVRDSRSYSADEALDGGLVDLVVESRTALLAQLDGRTVEKAGAERTLETLRAPVREVMMPPLKRVLARLASPDLAAILLSLGMLGIYFELSNPGAIFPGVLGAICLLLAFAGLSVLPVNYAGIALMALAVVLFVAEVKVPSFGLLTLGGVVSLVLGSLMLFDSPEPALQVSRSVIVGVAVTALVFAALLVPFILRSRRERVRTGSEGLVGAEGRAFTDLEPRGDRFGGKVFVQGEIWNAVSDGAAARDEPVRVVAVDGMTLSVTPLSAPASPAPSPSPASPSAAPRSAPSPAAGAEPSVRPSQAVRLPETDREGS